MTIKSELLEIQMASGGVLYAAKALDWAKDNAGSALHNAIEWDDLKAAHAHRLWQVRQIIQLHIVADDGAPLMVSLSIDRKADGGYRSIADVVKTPDLRDIMLADALAELSRMQIKYQRVVELTKVWEEAEQVRGRKRRRRSAA